MISSSPAQINSLNFVWDVGLLTWVVETQPGGGTGGGGSVTQGTSPWVISGAVTGPLTDTQLRALAVPISLASAPTTPVTNAGLTNIDVALSTRTKPSDQQHVIVDSSSSVAVTGPLTDTQLRALAVPISGTVTANAGSNLNTSLLALDATLTNKTLWAKLTDGTRDALVKAASTLPALTDTALVTTQRDPIPAGTNVIGHVITDAGSVTAATLQAETTKVIGTVNIASAQTIGLAAGSAVVGHVIADSGSTTAVTGNVAVTNAGLTNIDVALSTRLKPADTLAGVTTVTSITNAVTVAQATPASLQATVTQLTLTKGTQGSTGVSTQDLKDAGRTSIAITATVASTAVGETLITVNKSSGLGVVSTPSSIGITTGKRLRIQAISCSARNSTGTTASNVTVNMRAAVGGATSASSPLQLHFVVALPASTVSTLFPTILIPDGFEIDSNGATNTYGFTITHPQWVTGSVVATFDLSIIGYEY